MKPVQSAALAKLNHVDEARLPTVYAQAKSALVNCARIDECKDWADRAEALASYARQSGDKTLRQMADRIQARAIRRCGELLRQIMPGKTGPKKLEDRAHHQSKTAAARQAGLSEQQQKTATRVARVPVETFEALIEADDPPTVTEIAARGVMARVAAASSRPGFARATEAVGHIGRLADFCGAHDPTFVAHGITGAHLDQNLYSNIGAIERWLARFTQEVRKRDDAKTIDG